jgi:hypothetical protein
MLLIMEPGTQQEYTIHAVDHGGEWMLQSTIQLDSLGSGAAARRTDASL